MKKDFEITIGHPFENEWEIDYDIWDEDKIDSSINFLIKDKEGIEKLTLSFNYGMSVVKFHGDEKTKVVVSIFETDLLEEGEYTYEYVPKTFGGKEIANLSGKLFVTSSKSDQEPVIKRQVRPWDLLRSKKPGEVGERASDEKQEQRMSICQQCPRFVKLTSQCLECGCIMNLKTKLEHATCPLGKW
jgi:hypothetical protein